MKILLRLACAAIIGIAGTTLASPSLSATESGGEPSWTCEKGSGYCCDCTWSSTFRQCRQAAEDGTYYEKCGVADDFPCTGTCSIF